MARFIWCEIVCASCAATTAGRFTSTTVPRREMTADAEADGWQWRYSPDDEMDDWFCRQCSKDEPATPTPSPTGD